MVDPKLKEHLAALGKKGGHARAAKMSAKQRSRAARKAIKARWAKYRAKYREQKQK